MTRYLVLALFTGSAVLTACSDPPVCGDGVRGGAEECDADDLGGMTCQDLGFQTGALRCGLYSCTFVRSDCSSCGNAKREGAEECDGDDLDHQTCLTLGYHGGGLGCYSACFFDVTDCARFGWCGNGTMEAVEACDDSNEVDWDGCTDCQVSEYLVHPGAALHGGDPAVASPDGAESLVVWDGGSHDVELVTQGIYGRRFDAWGYPQGEPFLLNDYPEGGYPAVVYRSFPQVAMAETGQSIVVWEIDVVFAGIDPGIYGRRLDSEGTPVWPELRLSQDTTHAALAPRVAMDGAGGFVVVWQANALDGDGWGIFGRRFDPDGNALGDAFQINTSTQLDQTQPRVAASDAGAFIVSWYTWKPVFPVATARWYDEDGVPQTGEVELASQASPPAVSMTADGTSVVVWSQPCSDGTDRCLLAQIVAPAATASGPVVEVNLQVGGPTEVCLKDDGSFVVAWVGWSPGQVDNDVFLQRMDAWGERQGDPYLAHVYTADNQESPSISTRCANGWVAVWHSFLQDGDGYGVYAQRYDADGVPQGIGP